MITVVNKYKHKSTDTDIYIGRGSALGNPFTSIKDKVTKAEHICESREDSITQYETWLNQQILDKNPLICNMLNDIYKKSKDGNVNLVLITFNHNLYKK